MLGAARKANFTDKDMAVLEEFSKTAGDVLSDAEKVLRKINVKNTQEIMNNMGLLGISLPDLITNPGIFFEFLGNKEKSMILVNLQSLLPR